MCSLDQPLGPEENRGTNRTFLETPPCVGGAQVWAGLKTPVLHRFDKPVCHKDLILESKVVGP